MASADDHNAFHDDPNDSSIISARGLEAFGRKVTTTASNLIGPLDPTQSTHYQSAMGEVSKQLRRPTLQRSMFSLAKTTPTDMVRSRLSTSEIQHRALSYISDTLLKDIPEHENSYSLFMGFQASFPDFTYAGKKHGRRVSRGRKLIEEGHIDPNSPHAVQKLQKEKSTMLHEFEMLNIRKNMASSEIREIDNRIANLNGMRKIILDRLADLEQEESMLEHDIVDVENRLEEAEDLVREAESVAGSHTPTQGSEGEDDGGFMSQSIYEKLPSANSTPTRLKKPRNLRKKSMPILHEHYDPGTSIREIRAHKDCITAMDFDAPFGTLVTSALDDSIRVWDLNAGRCMGNLEGHTASVRALQVEDNICATGSVDATIRLWDLSRARYDPIGEREDKEEVEAELAFVNASDQPVDPPAGSMDDCPLTTLQSHMAEITALHFRGDVLVSGSADKTIRQWDLEKGRCVQTLDVMWAAAQASVTLGESSTWKSTNRAPAQDAPFVGALQVFDAALACGTADGMVRLWDLRSGQVHRSLVGHTGPLTCLQFDDMHLVTGSLDRSIRIWDLRTGSLYDAFAYDLPVTDMSFDSRRIVSAAGEDVVKVYDKLESRQWDCGAGVNAVEEGKTPAIVERVRIRDGYMAEARQNGVVGVWSC